MRTTNFSTLSSKYLTVIAIIAMALAALPVTPAYAASITVTNPNDDLTNGNGCSLREAIINANDDAATYPDCAAGTGTDTIVLASGTTYTLSLLGAGATAGDLDISDADGLTIQADGAAAAIIDAASIDRVIDTTAASGPLTLVGITVTNGNATAGGTGGGIGHASSAALTLTNSTVSNNIATSTSGCGAGIYNNTNATINISDSTIEWNNCTDASSDGGGLWKGTGGTVNISNSTFYNNSALGDGGGMRLLAGTVTITNSTFASNTAGNRGGAVQVNGATVTVGFSTFSDNAANGFGNDGGGAIQTSAGSVAVTASILANSTAGRDCDLSLTGTATLTNTLVEDNVDCSIVSVITQDPDLGALTDNGGPTQTMAITQTSPAYNAASSCGSASTDQRGIARPQFGDCDLGAYELQDTVDPVVLTIVRADANPTSAASVDFTVVFSEAVTGVDGSDFILSTTGSITGASVTAVNGTGDTYTVTVNTGSWNGTLQLDVKSSGTGIEDLSGNPLNGGFTGGESYDVQKGLVNVSPGNIAFGGQLNWVKSDPQTVTVTNNTGSDVNISSLRRSSGKFLLADNTCTGTTLGTGTSCTFDVIFRPTGTGVVNGKVTIVSDDPDGPHIVTLSGNGLGGTQLMTNNSFEQDSNGDGLPNNWVSTGLNPPLDGMNTQFAKSGTKSIKMVGQSVNKSLVQVINHAGSANDDFLFVVWSKAQSVPAGWFYRAQISFYNGNTLVHRRIKDYTPGTHDWEYQWVPITVPGAYDRIEFEVIYKRPSGTVWFDSASLKWAP